MFRIRVPHVPLWSSASVAKEIRKCSFTIPEVKQILKMRNPEMELTDLPHATRTIWNFRRKVLILKDAWFDTLKVKDYLITRYLPEGKNLS